MCGYYLAIGMPLDEYWCASPHLAKYYREAHKLRVEQRNQELWLQGLYIYNAFCVVLANAFGKKGGKRHNYLEKPLNLFGNAHKQEEEERVKETNRIVNTLNMIQMKFNANKEGKEGKVNGD